MHGSKSLNGTWGLTWVEGSALIGSPYYTGLKCEGRELLAAPVPAPIHRVLLDLGMLPDPNVGLNSLAARWVEEQFWTYRHVFTADWEELTAPVWLCFDWLELMATVWLNGEQIGTHANAHRPARFEITGKLRPGENLLVVQLTSGMHEACDWPVRDYMPDEISQLTRRPWLRKAQYQCGWDWNPRLMNLGILGDVRLEWCLPPRLDQVTVFAVPSDDLTSATFHARVTVENTTEAEVAGTLRARIVETEQEIGIPVVLPSGESRHEATLEVAEPRLWWPVGHGEPFRYTVEVELEAGGETQSATRHTGVRRVEMDQSPHPETGRYCLLKINNRPIFCKGGNWVPPDLFPSTVTLERTRELVDLALEANFNLLRVWGGAVFAHHLAEVCDEAGVLIWHDFLFACAKYPGDDPAFAAEVRREITWAVREMAHHPSLVVWCGNNEIEWGDWAWGYDNERRTHPHYAMFHHDIPQIVRRENPSTLHWLSSPSSPDYAEPNDPTVGDQHPWTVSMEGGGANWWRYREQVDRFPNEGGVLGASSAATLRQFLPTHERRPFSPSWVHHDNPFSEQDREPGALGRGYKTLDLWAGRDAREMSLDDYAFLSGVLHAEGLVEYIANYRRRMFSSASAIFWMYNDSWPVTNGWTIVDYYLRKKLAYHPVRRAFQPVTVVVAEEEGQVRVFGVNDSPQDWSGEVRYGLFALGGGLPKDETVAATLPANASSLLAEFPRAEWEALGTTQSGAFAVLTSGGAPVAQYRLFVERFKDLEFHDPQIEVLVEGGVATFRSATYVWGVCLDVDGEAQIADNCFDLLPGIPYQLPWDGEEPPVVVRTGNAELPGR